MKEIFIFVLTALIGYLLGSIDTGIIVSKLCHRDDVRGHGSGGAGMTNMLRTFGKKAAILTALGDVLKGFLSVCLGKWLFANMLAMPPMWGAYVAYIFAVIGHWKPVFFGFKGGKCVLVSAGGLLALSPPLFVMLACEFLLFFLPTRMVSVGSIAMAATFPFAAFAYGKFVQHLPTQELWLFVAVTAFVGFLVVYLHRSNIKRILSGTEYRFDGKNKKNNHEK